MFIAVSPSSIFIRGSPLYSRPGAAYSSSSRSLYTPPLNSCLSDTGRCHSARVHRHSDWRKPESLHFLEDSTEYSHHVHLKSQNRTQHDWFRRFVLCHTSLGSFRSEHAHFTRQGMICWAHPGLQRLSAITFLEIYSIQVPPIWITHSFLPGRIAALLQEPRKGNPPTCLCLEKDLFGL